jgi:hypothetical protein
MRTAVQISVGNSKRLQALRNGLILALTAGSGIGLVQGDYRYLCLPLAAMVLRRSLRNLDPSGITLAFTPAAAWSCSVDGVHPRQAGGSDLRMTQAGADGPYGAMSCVLTVRGRTTGLIWLEVTRAGTAIKKPLAADIAGPGRIPDRLLGLSRCRLSARPDCCSWLIFADALPDADWRCLRRTLRLQAYRGEEGCVPG